MRKTQSEGTPGTLIIENPFTGKFVNILPLLQYAFCHQSGFNSGEKSVLKVLDDAIRLISCHSDVDDFDGDNQMLVFNLYEMRDAMEASSELTKTGGKHAK